MFLVDTWNDLLRFVVWMAPTRPLAGGSPPPGGGGSGSGSGGGSGGDNDPEDIFRRYYEKLFRWFRRRGASREDAKDLTQETLFRVYRNIGRFRGEASLGTWIFSIAKNVWRNDLRWWHTERREGEEVSLKEISEAIEPRALAKILEDEERRKLYEALARLPPRMRQCVFYRIHQDLKYREIAALMGTSIGTVKAQLAQAKDLLEKELGPYFDSFDL
jgi:RNA polymerase sigma-70 factor (ECF subfamily)